MIMVPLCVGIDPAPSGKARRGNAVVILESGENLKFEASVTHDELRRRLEDWKKRESVLLAWDAPLTGPSDPDSPQAGARNSELQTDFTTREIERVYGNGDWKPAEGISVQGYAGCQHWALSRNLLGLPRVGPYDIKPAELPFNLLVQKPDDWRGQNVVEVHPALAMWLWLRGEKPELEFQYKTGKTKERRRIQPKLLERLLETWADMGVPPQMLPSDCDRQKFAKSPDLLDALVAAILAYLWVTPLDGVELLGDQRKGTFLLPTKTGLPSLGQASS
jgi:predicted RNase H-like nuclease